MTTNSEILNYASSLTDTFVTVPTNEWGSQCIVLVDKIVQHFTDKNLSYTNAIDALNKAKSNGFSVELDSPGKAPKATAFYVVDTSSQGNPYGHIGMATQDSDGTEIIGLEANVDGFTDTNADGVNDQYQVGGKVRAVKRDWYADGSLYVAGTNIKIGKVIGWFYLPVDSKKESEVALKIEKKIRGGIPQVGVTPYRQVHAHSTGNPNSTAQNEADYMMNKDINTGFYTHVVGNSRIIQVANTNRGAWDVGGGWNMEGYASVELIESHKNKNEFMVDYKLYINLLRQLAKEAGIPTTLDNGSTGIISHAYATAHQPNNFSDHVDPYPYLAKWGINKAQFASDLAKGFGQVNIAKAKSKAVIKRVYQANDVKFVHGIYQIKCDYLAPTQFTWTENGIPVAMVNWVDKNGKNLTDGKDKDFKKGMYFTFAGDEAHITDTGEGGENYGYYWRKFIFGEFGEVWLSAYDKNHLVNK